MFGAIRHLLIYRVLGGRIMLALTLLGFVRRLLGSRRTNATGKTGGPGSSTGVYQPSQGSSQIVQREPR
jgi:hypothetical protein